ncbi:SDR family oxidoreductase [Salipaludibacillus agaradhaerens]|jgi:polyketide synthase PksJ|uniref:type I polyketide synthase n=1 Tax=Salipaludibacillus agaradhaerens TaxID=76935 RepID=UPI00215183EE|nr:type I polyketide synthase [Salipaludibacillus agaradhaerens]MCR6105811.1 SDR family oxidoreductase [Salipaludibacillus agaradhaerens]MCR6117847.1 SDR family oxidoreductase [Salipaludibacillus agaradhaerens]
MSIDDIAIVGMSAKLPKASSIHEYWENLVSAKECITRWGEDEYSDNNKKSGSREIKARGIIKDVDKFDATFFDINTKEAELLDPQHRLFMETAWEGFEDAGYDISSYNGVVSVYAACGKNTYLKEAKSVPKTPAESFQQYITNGADFLPSRVAYKFNLKGEAIAVQTACSSSLVAVDMACKSLLVGSCDMALAGGVHIELPQEKGYLYQEGMIFSHDGYCRPFDHLSKGQVDGNGVGVVVLKKYKDAIEDGDNIYAVIKGSCVNNDGRDKVGYTAPSVMGQAETIATAIGIADIPVETISYVEAHASATPLGDPIEIKALTQAFRMFTSKKNFCGVGSVKGSIGHLNHASGIAGIIKVILSLYHKKLPGTLHYKKANPEIDFEDSPFYVFSETKDWNSKYPRRAGVSSFGIGGTNAHVVLEEAPVQLTEHVDKNRVITLSARSPKVLLKMKNNLLEYCNNNPDKLLDDIAYTLHVGRQAFNYRWATIVSSTEELIVELEQAKESNNIREELIFSDEYHLTESWLKGNKVDWLPLYKGECRKRISLPTYPFEKCRYWLRNTEQEISFSTNERLNQIKDWFYKPVWNDRSQNNATFKSMNDAGLKRWLIFANENELFSQVLVNKLLNEGCSVIIVYSGNKFEKIEENLYKINYKQSEDYYKIIKLCIKEGGLDAIAHCWGYKQYGFNNPKSRKDIRDLLYMSLLYLVQRMGEFELQSVSIFPVTSDAQFVNGVNKACNIEKSSVFGLCKVIPQENTNLSICSIDFSFFDKEDETLIHVDQFLNELLIMEKEEEVVYWKSKRLVPGYKAVRVPQLKVNTELKDNGTYLITGGLGKIGLTLALFLSEQYQANIILTSRSGLTPEETWDLETDPVLVNRYTSLKKMKETGSDITVAAVDVTDRLAMEELIKKIKEKYGLINGVIHAAGAADSSYFRFIRETTDEVVEDMFSSKIEGTYLLSELFEDEPIDFFLNCSSLSPILGGLTFGAYGAANRFQDVFAEYQRVVNLKPWVSVNWETWNFPFQKAGFGTAIADSSISPEEGVEIFTRILNLDLPRIAISTTNLVDRINAVNTTLTKSSFRKNNSQNQSFKSPLESFEKLESTIVDIFKGFFGEIEIKPTDDFFSLGGTSLEVLHLLSDAEKAFGIEIPLEQGFRALTVNELAKLCHTLLTKSLNEFSKLSSEENMYVYEYEIDGEVALVTISESDYLNNNIPEGAKNIRPLKELSEEGSGSYE